ncbi:MAG: alpha/beta hydrolase [Bryobacteraceae bacterium]
MRFFTVAAMLTLPLAAQQEIRLWKGGPPGFEGIAIKEVVTERGSETTHNRAVSNIHDPSVLAYLPSADKATGAAVIVAPGGGHRYLAIDHEGYDVMSWLNSIGVAGFILKYRLARTEGHDYKVEVHALQDAQRAVRLVRSRAREWGIDPARIGMMGFSAGGGVTGFAATRFEVGKPDASDPLERLSSRPDFQVLVYPGIETATWKIPADAPPAFLVHADDDKLSAERSASYYIGLKKAGVSAEMHVYAHGGHGFGMRNRPLPVTGWTQRFQEWLADMKLLSAAPPATASR